MSCARMRVAVQMKTFSQKNQGSPGEPEFHYAGIAREWLESRELIQQVEADSVEFMCPPRCVLKRMCVSIPLPLFSLTLLRCFANNSTNVEGRRKRTHKCTHQVLLTCPACSRVGTSGLSHNPLQS